MSRLPYLLSFQLLASMTIASWTNAAELPEAISTAIELGRTRFSEARAVAEKELADAFESEIKLIRRQTKLKAEEKLKQVELVTAEQNAFKEFGVLPLSPRMRSAISSYLKRLKEARKVLGQIYDKAIDYYTKAGDDGAAADMVKKKNEAFDVRCIAYLQAKGVTWEGGLTIRLFDDGRMGESGVWILEKNGGITIRTKPDKISPPEGWIESWVVEESGQVINATNQLKSRWRGTLSPSEANSK